MGNADMTWGMRRGRETGDSNGQSMHFLCVGLTATTQECILQLGWDFLPVPKQRIHCLRLYCVRLLSLVSGQVESDDGVLCRAPAESRLVPIRQGAK